MYMSVKEIADLRGCTGQSIRNDIASGLLPAEVDTSTGRRKYLIPLSALPAELQIKYYRQHEMEIPEELQDEKKAKKPKPPVQHRPIDEYTAAQRDEIAMWTTIVEDWELYRSKRRKDKARADEEYVEQCRRDHPDIRISIGILRRKAEAVHADNLDGLVEKRGAWRRGKTDCPDEIRDLLEYWYLDEHALPVTKCLELTAKMIRQKHPELKDYIPSKMTAYRITAAVPKPLAILAREGEKAFNDKCGEYINRMYTDIESNEYWVADGHTVDVISKSEDGSEHMHRLTLSAFLDVRSGIYVGWAVTDNPSSDTTLLALRKAILRYGPPKYIITDNGREYLTTDLGGLGHRTKKTKNTDPLPTPILQRLGIQLVNALPRNGQAKIIEREFRNFTGLARLFDAYCGSNPAVKPEKLKHHLKAGNIPTDGELISVIDDMIEGYYNCQPYNGKARVDKGKTKMEVFKQRLKTVRKAPEDVLSLLMMRSTRLQKIGRNGVHITISGEKIYYFNDNLKFMQDKRVFVRYDPEDLDTVRVYDEQEAYLMTVPMRDDMQLLYGHNKDDISAAMSEKRRWQRTTKEQIALRQAAIERQYGHISALDVYVRDAKINREAMLAEDPTAGAKVIEILRADEPVELPAAVGDGGTPPLVDRRRMIRNLEDKN